MMSMSSASFSGLLNAGLRLHTTFPLAKCEPPHSAQLMLHPLTVKTDVRGSLSQPNHGRAPDMSLLRRTLLIIVP